MNTFLPYIHTVQYYETDKMGITHHSNYIRWMEEARVALLDEIGWGYERMEAMGIQSPVIGIDCRYKAPTTFRDRVEIETKIQEYKGIHLIVAYTMRRIGDNKIVLEGTSRHCFLDPKGRFLRLKRDFPALDEALEILMKETEDCSS